IAIHHVRAIRARTDLCSRDTKALPEGKDIGAIETIDDAQMQVAGAGIFEQNDPQPKRNTVTRPKRSSAWEVEFHIRSDRLHIGNAVVAKTRIHRVSRARSHRR